MPAPDPTAIDVAPDAEIGQKLKRAKAAGAAVRARISATMGLAGGALVAVLVAAVAIAGAADTIRAVNYAALLCIGIPGPPLLLLAVLPTDRLVIYGVAAVCCAVSLVCAALIAARVKKRQEAEWKAVQYVMVVGFVSVAAVVGSAARLPPRAALRRTWICLGVAYFAAALIFLYISVTCVNPGMKPGSREHQFWCLATAELFVLGAASSWPSFRQRVHAALLARGRAERRRAKDAAMRANAPAAPRRREPRPPSERQRRAVAGANLRLCGCGEPAKHACVRSCCQVCCAAANGGADCGNHASRKKRRKK